MAFDNRFIKEYLNFTAKERIGVMALISIVVLCCLFQVVMPYFIKEKQYTHKDFENEIASLKFSKEGGLPDSFTNNHFAKYQYNRKDYSYNNNYQNENELKGELFYFDPNTIGQSEWERLGLREKTIATIQNYLSKGGRFYQPEDIRKIWGLSEQQADRLIPYIQIVKEEKEFTKASSFKPEYEKKTYTPVIVDINSADTTAYIALPGIGSKLAQRIITYREKLGGFNNIEQVGETFGLPDSTFQKIKTQLILNNSTLKKININTISFDELKQHPYIRYNIANIIIQYRTQHGNFSKIEDLKKIVLITDEIYNKIAPYMAVN